MKLARPDIRHPRIVLAGSPDGDDADLQTALRRRGLQARWLPWTDSGVLDADLVILRTTTDLVARSDEFLAWTRRIPNLLNAPDVVAWNMGTHHLPDLRTAGVPVVGYALSGAAVRTALVFLGGIQSHAFVEKSAVDADFELWDLGQSTLQAAADHLGIAVEHLLYARVDVIGGPSSAEVLDVNLVAPQLGWRLLDAAGREDAQRRFALCVGSALERLGLGPFSHRRP